MSFNELFSSQFPLQGAEGAPGSKIITVFSYGMTSNELFSSQFPLQGAEGEPGSKIITVFNME